MHDHVVVSGGGIAGTSAALALATAGIPVTVVEPRPADHDEGAVVRLNPNGMDALRAVGVAATVVTRSFPLIRNERVAPDGHRLGYRLAADPASERGLPRVMHWPALLRVLREAAVERGAHFRHGHGVVDLERTGDTVTAVLADGARIPASVLVGADGTHSRVRRLIDPDAPAPERLGTRTVYGFAPAPPCRLPPPEVLRAYMGARTFFAATRDSHSGGCFWFTSLPASEPTPRGAPADPERLRAEMIDLFGGDIGHNTPTGIAASVVEHSTRILSFDDHALEHLPRWYDDRAVVVGDALHVAPPASEQGAAMAVEDGVELARCLRTHPVPHAFAVFERRRRARVEAVVAMGRAGTSAAHRRGPLGRRLRVVRDRVASLSAWQRRPPTGGPAWAFDHHIAWDEPVED